MISSREKLADIVTGTAVYRACILATRGKHGRAEIKNFDRKLMLNMTKIQVLLLKGDYRPSKYREFQITDPKPRTVLAQPIRDRVVHQIIVPNIIVKYFVRRFDRNSCACIKGRGSHYAVSLVKQGIRKAVHGYGKGVYIVKMDISGFFYNIDRIKLYKILEKRIKDPDILEVLFDIIFDPQLADSGKGVPIGNYPSQFFANIVLDALDKYMRSLGIIIEYIRYMDDFIMIVKCKKDARQAIKLGGNFLLEELGLELNPKSTIMPYTEGVDFAGYHIHYNCILLRKKAIKKAHRIINEFKRTGDVDKFVSSSISWFGHACYADSFHFIQDNFGPYKHLFPENIQKLVFQPGYKDYGMLKKHLAKPRAFQRNAYDKYVDDFWDAVYSSMDDQVNETPINPKYRNSFTSPKKH